MREETIINAINDIDDIRCKIEDIHEVVYHNSPDYWEKLKHQAAISVMSAFIVRGCEPKQIAQLSIELAGVMVEKLKNKK